MKCHFYTYSCGRADFIEIQNRSLHHFIQDDFDFTVFNNSVGIKNILNIRKMCKGLKIPCIEIPRIKLKDASLANAIEIQWSFQNYIRKQTGYSCILDSDMFPIRDFSVSSFLDGNSIAGCEQKKQHVKYLWTGLIFMNIETLPDKKSMNFFPGLVDGVATDTGGHLYEYLRQHEDLKVKYISQSGSIMADNKNLNCLPQELLPEYEDEFQFEIYEKSFLHYFRGSNWDNKDEDFVQRKTKLLNTFIDGLIDGSITAVEW